MGLLAFELSFRFLWGTLLITMLFVSRQETSERFIRIAAYIASGVAAFMAIFLVRLEENLGQTSLSLALLLGSYFVYAFPKRRWGRLVALLLLLCSPLLYLTASTAPLLPRLLNFVSSSLVFGSVFAALNLGHWYLNVPGMNIRELRNVVNSIFIALLLKSTEICWTLFISLDPARSQLIDPMGRPLGTDLNSSTALYDLSPSRSLFEIQGDYTMGLGLFGVLLLTMRILWGIVAPLILGYMVKKTVESRSTQSATGILYAMSVMIIVGEACALFLSGRLGWNL
jgi:hypothetical protein